MTKLTEMWTALAEYQPKADADGHGVSWAKMCSKRTSDAAVGAAYSYGVTYAAARAADFAARAADFAAASAADDYYAAADYAARAIEYIKEALAQQDAETHLQAVSDFGQLQALSEPSECWDCRCLQENEQDNDVICDPCRWAKEAASQPAQEPFVWPTMPPSIGQSPVLFESGYDEGLAKCMSMCKAAYTSPPQRQPLTDAEIMQIELSLRLYNSRDTYDLSLNEFARAIEAAHGIGDKA